MNHSVVVRSLSFPRIVALAFTLAVGGSASATILDNFDGATRSGWEDSNPANLPLKGGEQADGVFTFTMPPPNQAYFVASTKVSETFELKDNRTIEFRTDLLRGLGPDSFAVLAFIPKSPGANSLAGYGIAKSETDILITKGIGKYFFNQNPNPAIKNDNVTLVLNLSAKGGSVFITGRVLDKDDGNKVIWEQSFVDSPAADVLEDGTDNPAAPYINAPGNFVLYLYADGGKDPNGYQVAFDNAETFVYDTTTLDDFDAASRSGWEDSNPGNLPLEGGAQGGGVFTFSMAPIGQAYFVASTKKSKSFELKEGTRHEFSVDMVSGQGPDSFAVLGFIPTSPGANSLAGYGLAKSASDILVTKGIGKYFFNDDPTPAIKNENVLLVLTLTVRNGTVEIRGRVLDKDDNNAVLFDQSFVDTTAADVLVDGTDNPPAPYINLVGNVVLYLYVDGGTDPNGYQVVYDNLQAGAPPAAANEPPVISEILPKNGSNFLPPATTITFRASDDKPIADSGVSVILNGVVHTTANGLTLSAAGTSRTASLGGLESNVNYLAELKVTDSDGVSRSETIRIDTFLGSDRIVEIEDYNFESGQYFDNPVPTAEGGGPSDNSFNDRVGVEGTDFHDTRGSANGGDTMYRTQDPVRMAQSIDQARAAFDPNAGVYDYNVGDLAADEWLNYTREYAAGSYEVYLREAVIGFTQAESVLEQVTGDPTQPDAAVKPLGSFLGKLSGYTFQNVPLTDGTGQSKAILRLSGKTTFRLRHVTADVGDSANRLLNYLLFLPVADPGIQRASITALSPANGSTVEATTARIDVTIQNRDTSVKIGSIKLSVGGLEVAATVTPTPDGATVGYSFPVLPPKDTPQNAHITFEDNLNVSQSTDWSFTYTYLALDPLSRLNGASGERGMRVRLVQAPAGTGLANSLQRAEEQLAANSTIPKAIEASEVTQVINYSKDPGADGYFPDGDQLPPGLDPENNGTDDFAMEVFTYLELKKGVVRFGIRSDDGYKIASAKEPLNASTPPLSFEASGTADRTFDVVVPADGIYPFRNVFFERDGSSYFEWFTVNTATSERTLVNDVAAAGAVKAYQSVIVVAPTTRLQSSANVATGYVDDETAVLDANAQRFTVPLNGDVRYYRIKYALNDVPFGPPITLIQVVGGNVVIEYQ